MASTLSDENLDSMSIKQVVHILMGSLREYRAAAYVTPVLIAGEVAMECGIPFLTAILIDNIKDGAGMSTILYYGLILVIMAIASLAFGTLAGLRGSDASCGLAKNLREDLFDTIQSFSFSNIDSFSAPSLVTRLTTDVNNVQQSFMMSLILAIRAPMMFVFALIMAFIMAGKMAVIYVLVGPLLGVMLFFIFRAILPVFSRVFKRYDSLNERIEENIHGIREVKAYVREDFEEKKFKKATFNLYRDFSLAERIMALSTPAMNLAIDVVFVFVMYFGSYEIITTQGTAMDVGQFSALTTYGFMILISLMMFSMVFGMVVLAEEPAKRIVAVLEEKPEIVSPENPVMQVRDGSVCFDDVSFKYKKDGERNVLSDLNFAIDTGEVVGILGATGSAKTSLVQLILRLYDVSEGAVLVGGVDVRDYDLDTLRQAVALVEQKNMLFSGSIYDNLRWGNPDASEEEMRQACKIACADEFISKFPEGYNTQISQGGTNVSGGQKQRLCIARALLKNPKILIFDDSTSAVDTKTDANIRSGLAEFAHSTTKIIIAQRISSLQHADKIFVLDKGFIVGCGTHDELMENDKIYAETYRSQTKDLEEGGEL